jgi:hypothetical protein
MVRSYLIENRICYKSDGGSSSGGGDDGASATPAQTDARGRPLVRGTTNVIDASRQILPPEDDGPSQTFTVTAGQDNVARSNPNEMRAREQAVQDDYISQFRPDLDVGSSQARDAFANLVSNPSPGISAQVAEVQRAERAAAERQARRGGLAGSGQGTTLGSSDDLSAFGPGDGSGRNIPNASTAASRQAALRNLLIQGTGNENIDGRNVLTDLEIRSQSPFGGSRAGNIAEMAFSMDPNVVPVINAQTNMIVGYQNNGRYTGRPGFDPVQSGFYGGQGIYGNRGRFDDETGAFFIDPPDPSDDSPDPQYDEQERERLRRLAAEQEQIVDPGTTTPEQIDDLAVNYLQSPYFNYSGPGNLFQPYGYAANTLVDLLQTRNMTMPDEASPNLNLFGNPRDFT